MQFDTMTSCLMTACSTMIQYLYNRLGDAVLLRILPCQWDYMRHEKLIWTGFPSADEDTVGTIREMIEINEAWCKSVDIFYFPYSSTFYGHF